MNSALRKQILREFPELAAGYHLPIAAEVTAIPDAPTTGGINDNYRPRYAVDVVLLDHNYIKTDIELNAIPVAIQGGGNERGLFALPPKGTVVELAWLNGSPERPFVRSILGDRQALPWLNTEDMSWQQSEEVKQSVDKHGHWQRITTGDITDEAHTHTKRSVNDLATIGQELKRVLEHSIEDIDGKKVIEASAIHQLSATVLNLLALGSVNTAASDHITRSAAKNIVDHAEGDLIQTASKIHIGNDSTNVLQLLIELIDELTSALNAISTMTVVCASPGAPSTPPTNAASFVSAATKLTSLKTKLNVITK